MLLEKNKIRRIIRDHRISFFKEKDEDELVNIFYETLTELNREQENKLATKEDIRMLMQLMDKRFEAVDKRFEDLYRYMDKRFEAVEKRFEEVNRSMDKRFSMLFIFMNIGFGVIILLVTLFKFLG